MSQQEQETESERGWAMYDLSTDAVQDVARQVCDAFDVPYECMSSTSKSCSREVLARGVAMYVARIRTRCSYTEIGRVFRRDHSSVIHRCKKIESLMATDQQLRAVVDRLVGS